MPAGGFPANSPTEQSSNTLHVALASAIWCLIGLLNGLRMYKEQWIYRNPNRLNYRQAMAAGAGVTWVSTFVVPLLFYGGYRLWCWV